MRAHDLGYAETAVDALPPAGSMGMLDPVIARVGRPPVQHPDGAPVPDHTVPKLRRIFTGQP